MDLPWLDHPSSAAPGVQPAARSLRLLEVDEARRRAVEDFVRERFAAHYQARVRHFMPRLFALEAADGSLHGAVGCRGAAEQGLFLERYLDEPVESVIARRTGERVEREGIVEVGNLAAHGAGTARLLIIALTRIPAAGAEVEDTVFIRRRLRDGDLVTGAPPAAVPAGKPASKGD